MIYTITLNPAVDYFMSLKKFELGQMNTSINSYALPAGKGINVSRVLKNFNIDSVAMGFVGGFSGNFIDDELKKNEIKSDFVKIKKMTRINIQTKDTVDTETQIQGQSPEINEDEQKLFFEKLNIITSDDIVVLSGSLPEGISSKIYAEIIELLPKKTKVILDARKEAFKFALQKKVFLVKPNKEELEEVLGKKLNSDSEIILAGKEIQNEGAENVLISLGSKGSIFITKNNVIRSNLIKGNVISTIGAGDSMVAGFIYGLSQNFSLEECYKFAVASGSGTVFSEGLTSFEIMKKIYSEIIVHDSTKL